MANDNIVLAGEQAFVVNESGMVTNFRLGDGTRRFSELPDIIQYDQGSFVAVTTNALPTPAAEVGYSQFLTEGTYTHASGGFTVPAGKTGVGVWNGSTWALTNVVDLPNGATLSQDYTAGTYEKDETRLFNGTPFRATKTTNAIIGGTDWEIVGISPSLVKSGWYTRAKFTFDKDNHSIAWDNSLYIFNRGKNASTGAGYSYSSIPAGSISFATKVVELPTDYWYIAYAQVSKNFLHGVGSGSAGAISIANIIIKGCSEDVNDLRKWDYIVLFEYNAYNKTIRSPFFESLAQTKALEKIELDTAPVFNKYPHIPQKIGKSLGSIFNYTGANADTYARIVCVGNSLFARTQYNTTTGLPISERPPTLESNNFVYSLFEYLKVNKPLYRRYDYAGLFTENGTFTVVETNTAFDDSSDIPNSAKFSETNNASVSFVIDGVTNYFNFIDRTHLDNATTNVTVSISAGNDVVQCRIEGDTNWVEANGFSFSQLNQARDLNLGIGNTKFQRRIEFKKVGSGIGTEQTITIQNAENGKKFNYWGIELIEGNNHYTQVINVGRGSHSLNTSTRRLNYYVQTDVIDRKPNLVILEVPLLNMISDQQDISTNVNSLIDFVWGDRVGYENPVSLKNKSNNWADFQVLLIIPHHSRSHFVVSGGGAFLKYSTGVTALDIYNAIKGEILRRGDLPMIDISSAMMYAVDKDPLFMGNYYLSLGGSNPDGDTYVVDGTHPNDKGVAIWKREILPVFR